MRTRHAACRLWWPLTLAMLLPATAAHAVAYLPGTTEPDPPTGDTASASPQAAEPLRSANGIQWMLAPWRYGGTLSFDTRWQRLDDGSRTLQGVLYGDIEFASYIWQPWFIQLRAGVGALTSQDRSADAEASAPGYGSTSLTGRFTLSVFPASRFPFELRGDATDSRTSGDALGGAYRTQRIALTQSYRPERANHYYLVNLEHSRIVALDGAIDTLSGLQATALQQYAEHTVELGATLSLNERSDTGDSSRISTLTGRHGFHPTSDFTLETLATRNELHLHSGRAGPAVDVGSDVRQVSSLLTWRPREESWLNSASAPLTLTGSARWVDAGATSGLAGQRVQAVNATLGLTKEFARAWRMAGALSVNRLDGSGAGAAADSVSGTLSTAYTPEGLEFGRWRYTPSVSANLAYTRASDAPERNLAGLQLTHGVTRDFVAGDGQNLALTLSQSAAAVHETPSANTVRALAHSAGIFWQALGDGAGQTFAGLSVSDARTFSQSSGRFTMVNLQLSRRTQVTRHTSWSANLTLQASRNDAADIDPFTGAQRQQASGWQQFHSGSVSYESQRVLGVPRLRFTALLAANSQQLERRAAGDFDAPRERITESLEGRFDYAIGRLDTRLSARAARVDGRSVASIYARIQRRF